MPIKENTPGGEIRPGGYLYSFKFPFVEFKAVANINSKWEQCDGDFGDNSGIVVFDEGIVATNVNNSTKHRVLLMGFDCGYLSMKKGLLDRLKVPVKFSCLLHCAR